MKTKILAGLIVFASLPFIAKAAADSAFYIFIAVALIVVVLAFRRKRRPQQFVSGGPEVQQQSKRRRVIQAVRAVRRNRMTLAEASVYFNVTEREIKTIHYIDYLLTY